MRCCFLNGVSGILKHSPARAALCPAEAPPKKPRHARLYANTTPHNRRAAPRSALLTLFDKGERLSLWKYGVTFCANPLWIA